MSFRSLKEPKRLPHERLAETLRRRVLARGPMRVTIGRCAFATAALVLAFGAAAEPYEDGLLRLDLPSGYDGPVSASQDASTRIVAFRWPSPGATVPTLLQITEHDLGATLRKLPNEERGNVAEQHLLELLGGVARRRSEFESSAPERLDLGGVPGAKIEWRGTTLDRRLSGILYCVVLGTTVVSLHTQDFEPAPAGLREAIVRAIESMALTARRTED